MAWLAVDKNGEEYLYLKKPKRYSHHNVFNYKEIDYEQTGIRYSGLRF